MKKNFYYQKNYKNKTLLLNNEKNILSIKKKIKTKSLIDIFPCWI
jgi:hypothetical protein